jgi:hypothetical protein
MNRARAFLAALLLAAGCLHQSAPADGIIASPDQQHVLFYSSNGVVRSVDAATGVEVGRATNLPYVFAGTFSDDGAVILTSRRGALGDFPRGRRRGSQR